MNDITHRLRRVAEGIERIDSGARSLARQIGAHAAAHALQVARQAVEQLAYHTADAHTTRALWHLDAALRELGAVR
jgi:hypothetical protein